MNSFVDGSVDVPTPDSSVVDPLECSVIIPCHNVQHYVGDTLAGLAANAAPGREFLLVDDASSDETAAILARAAERIPGARVITNETNLGLAATRNVGIAAARGRFLTFLDGDDLIMPGYLDQLVGSITELDCDFVRTDHVRFTGSVRTVEHVPFGPRRRRLDPRQGILPDHRRTGVDYPYAWAGIYHRRLAEQGLLQFTPGLRTCEDRPWIWRLHLQARSCATVGLRGLFYRRNLSHSLSQVTDERQFDFLPAFDQIIAEVQADHDHERFVVKALRSYCAMICHHLARPGYTRELSHQLRRRCVAALHRMPEPQRRNVINSFEPERQALLSGLVQAA